MRFSVWDGRLIVFSSISAFTPFMIRLDEAAGAMTDLPELVAQTAFVSPESDQCFYARGRYIFRFNGGVDQVALWQSRELVLPAPDNFGVCKALIEGAWTIGFYADGVLRYSKSLTTGETTFRLPAGFKSDRWKFAIQGIGRFREMAVARTPNQLTRG